LPEPYAQGHEYAAKRMRFFRRPPRGHDDVRRSLPPTGIRHPDDATLRECWARTRERHFRAPGPARPLDHNRARGGSPRRGDRGAALRGPIAAGSPTSPESFPLISSRKPSDVTMPAESRVSAGIGSSVGVARRSPTRSVGPHPRRRPLEPGSTQPGVWTCPNCSPRTAGRVQTDSPTAPRPDCVSPEGPRWRGTYARHVEK
jgi:hypothetical protein